MWVKETATPGSVPVPVTHTSEPILQLTGIFGDILGFLDKNNDLLYRNIKDVSQQNKTVCYVRQHA